MCHNHLQSQLLIGRGENLRSGLVIDVRSEGLEEVLFDSVSFEMMSLEVCCSEVIVTEVAGGESVCLGSVLDQELARGEVLPALLAAEHVVLLLVVLLIVLLVGEDLITELAVQQTVDYDLMN